MNEVERSETDRLTPRPAGLKRKPVGMVGAVAMTCCLGALALLLLYSILVFWPDSFLQRKPAPLPGVAPGEMNAPAATDANKAQTATGSPAWFFGTEIRLSDESRLILLVLLAGAMGSTIHSLRSLSWYVGNRTLVWSWAAMYSLLPLIGACLALIFYLVVRGGFFSPTATFDQTSPFGFAAMAGLVGLFSQQAALKLKQIAETLFTRAESGEDHTGPTQ